MALGQSPTAGASESLVYQNCCFHSADSVHHNSPKVGVHVSDLRMHRLPQHGTGSNASQELPQRFL